MKYEAPRAVRLADTATAQFSCENGPSGRVDPCNTGAAVAACSCVPGQFVASVRK
jgi:hypothetical protein